jgi:hypothetical protein
MQSISPLTISDFDKSAIIILGKAEVDKDGLGNFVELQDVNNFNIQSNITNIFQNTCAISFNIKLLNTKDRYSFYDTGASCYDYIKEGRRIRLYLGARLKPTVGELDDYYWSWLYGIIDKPAMQYDETGEICNISGRDYIAYLSETYLKKIWWGKNKKYDIVAEQEHYVMEEECKGIYRAFLDETGAGTEFKEIWLNSEWTYDWDINEFVFLKPNVPKVGGVGCLWLYYFTSHIVENVIADLLVEDGILNISGKYLWLNNPLLCTPTGKEVERVWFDSGTAYIRALNMLTEVVLYRFYINGNGEPCFKPIPGLSDTIKRIDDKEYLIRKTEERLDELYNHFIINGERREMRRNWLSVMAYSSIYNLTETSGKFRGAVTDDGGNLVTKRGFIWQIGEEAEQTWNEAGADLGIGYFEHIVIDFTPDTDYKFQAFAEDDKGNKRYSTWYYFKTEEGIS